MNFEEIKKNLTEKLGEETSAKVGDELANLMNYNTKIEKNTKKLEKEIETLKKDKEILIESNGKLLQQIGAENEEILHPKAKEETEIKSFDFRSVFDSKGNFIK